MIRASATLILYASAAMQELKPRYINWPSLARGVGKGGGGLELMSWAC